MANIEVDLSKVKNLGKEIRAGMVVSLGRLGEAADFYLRKEIKATAYQTGNLWQGVAPPMVAQGGHHITTSENKQGKTVADYEGLTVTLTVSARSARTSGGGVAHYPGGKTKAVALKPQIAFNYAEVVARGRPAIRPRAGKALLIEVKGTPSGAYISAGGQNFVVRKSAGAVPANPYDERAAKQVEAKVPKIVGDVFGELFN